MAPGPSEPQPTEATGTGAPEELAVNLQILSPSVGVNRPLLFPDLPAVTTIKQLKDRIRQALPLRPADENQRLIHRGRALLRESDSLLDVFGADALRTPDRHTIHLVVRESTDSHSSSPAPTTTRGLSPASTGHAPSPMVQQGTQIHFGPQPPPAFSRRTHSQPAAAEGRNARVPSPAPAQPHPPTDPALAFQQQHQNMSNWLSQIQREAMTRAIVHQNQRGRAHMGMRGIGDTGGGGANHTAGNAADPSGGRASPAPSHTVYRETIGPNGHSYQVETVIRSGTPGQQPGLSPVDVQNILRGADASQATAAMTSAMQRSASGASLHSRSLNQPGVTTPIHSHGVPISVSGRATPDFNVRPGLGTGQLPMSTGFQTNPARQGMEVYILSSPEGPRALLLNNSTAETYYTPRLRFQSSMPHLRPAASNSNLAFASVQPATPQNNNHQHMPQQHQQHQPQQQRNNADAINDQAPPPAIPQAGLHPANPPAAGIPPLLLQAWPHIWLIFRLAVFVWLFTSPTSSWSRWLTVICLAILVFLLSTGILNGVAENAWRPIGRHIEGLLPTPEQHVRRQQRLPAGDAPAEHQPLAQTRELDPAQMAARLMAERERQSWFTVQVRRLERAGLLFLASIAPGVAERHIANLEAETRAEETRRREAEEAAAAAAAATATEAEAEAEGNAIQEDGNQNNNETDASNPTQEVSSHNNDRQEQPQERVGRDGLGEDLIAL